MRKSPTQFQLDRLFTGKDPWLAIERISRQPPTDLIACLRERLPRLRGTELGLSVDLLSRLGDAGQGLLLDLLGREPKVTQTALVALSHEGTRLDYESLRPWLHSDDSKVLVAAIGAAGFVDDRRLIEEVFAHWDSDHRLHVALCLGRMRATEHTPDLVAQLASTVHDMASNACEFVAVALESMGDPASVPQVRELLGNAPDCRVWSLVQILRAASGEDRLADWLSPEQTADIEVLRRAWLDKEPSPLGLRSFEGEGSFFGEVLLSGTSRMRLGYPPTVSASASPRWSRALYIDEQILYHVNSTCPTCETLLAWAGAERPRRDADQVGHALSHVPELSVSWLRQIEPLLVTLPSGRAYLAVIELELERIDASIQERSWYIAREHDRVSNDPDDDWDEYFGADTSWPGTAHYQAKVLLRREPPTGVTVMPTQSLDAFDEQVVAKKLASVAAGKRPAALALCWFESRYVRCEYPEAVLQLVILDGHHTIEAYARAEIPARLVVIAPFAFGETKAAREHLTQLLIDPN